MPDKIRFLGKLYEQYRSQLSAWLRSHMLEVEPLKKKVIENYQHKGIVNGWLIRLPNNESKLYVLIDYEFPYSQIHMALCGESRYLEWPHVEEHGYLCLPSNNWLPIENLQDSISNCIHNAIELIDSCQSPEFIEQESKREFLSYWGRSSKHTSGLSTLDLENTETRLVTCKKTANYWLFGESDEAVETWLNNCGIEGSNNTSQAIFGFIDEAPALPFPLDSKRFIRTLWTQCSNIEKIASQLSPHEEIYVALAIQNENGIGLIGGRLSAIPSDGFSEGRQLFFKYIKWLLAHISRFDSFRVMRADSDWSHGRANDSHHSTLARSKVLLIGAGSLGSQVASRLAQAGVGSVDIVDPDIVEPNNIGRHTLGMNSVLFEKATCLAAHLRTKYPHSKFVPIPESWEHQISKIEKDLSDCDLIVRCVAEPSNDFMWDDWFRSRQISTPTVYGWLGTHGTTGNALALTYESPGLSCYFEAEGFLRKADTDFEGDTRVKTEPGCGTEFQPYGPLTVGQVELLVTRLCLDILIGKTPPPEHRVYACSTEDIHELGGKWTGEHLQYRPDGYDGPFEYKKTVDFCGECSSCKAQ
ncbi:MAG: ThiF family adenylyltransferase [Idiomarina sp.]|nr:ThiF family adenylyltransferase [Idiomarina sp.]